MKTLKKSTIEIAQPSQISAEQLIREGWEMAGREGEAAFESIEIRHAAEAKEAEVETRHTQAKGHVLLQLRNTLQAKLQELGFNIAQHLHEIARGRVDLKQAIALSIVSATLALFVLLAFGPIVIAILLALVVVGSVASVEEFFEALHEHHAVREGIFLATSIVGLVGQYWLGLVRGKLLGAIADSGPISHMLSQAGPLVQAALGWLAVVIEILAGWKLFRARGALLSPSARAFQEREHLNARLSHLGRALEATRAAPDINRHYRIIGARQQIAWSNGADQRAHASHLRRAAKGAIIALVIIAALFLLASRMFAAVNPAGNKIVLLDLSKSVGRESFKANLSGVTALIGKLQIGDRLIVIPITDRFGNSVLLDETMPSEAGYLGLQQQAAREAMTAKWQKVCQGIRPTYGRTDLVGALTVVSYLGNGTLTGTHILVLSDLQQSTQELDLEHVERISVEQTIARLKRTKAIPPLKGAVILAIGVDPVAKSTEYYSTLRAFWLEYFREAGAEVKAFSIDHRVPEF